MSKLKAVITDPVEIAAEGATLRGYLYLPAEKPSRAIVIHPATAVPQRFYAKFAEWLAEETPAAVLTYDYRDFGESARGHMRQASSDMADWGMKDQSAALNMLRARFPDLPVWVVGHSLGGVFAAAHDRADEVERVIAVASGPGHLLSHPPYFLPLALLFWFVIGPLTVRLFGYLPGKYSGLGADLPSPAFWQWRRWCLSERFHQVDWDRTMPAPDLTRHKGAVTIIGIADDVMVPPVRVRRLADYYPAAAEVEYREIHPRRVGLSGIGHLRIFSERCKAAWPLIVDRNAEAA